MKPNKILYIELNRIGDAVRASAVPRLLRKAFPAAYISCLTHAPLDELFHKDPHLDDIILSPHHMIRAQFKKGARPAAIVPQAVTFLEELRQHAFDLVINPYAEWGALIARYLAPAYVLGRVMDKKGAVITHGKEAAHFYHIMINHEGVRQNITMNFTEMAVMIVRDLGIDYSREESAPHIYTGPHDDLWADTFMAENQLFSETPLIGIHAGSVDPLKQWPIERFKELIEIIQKKSNAPVVLFGTPHDAQTLIPRLVADCEQQPVIVAGRATLLESAVLLKRCSLFVCNDSGPMHIAAAMGTPVIALMSRQRSNPPQCAPWGAGHTTVIKERMSDISVDEVWRVLERKLCVVGRA